MISSLRLVASSLLILPLLSGCFDLEQSLMVERDRLTYTAEIRMDARLAALSQQQSGKGKFCEPVVLPPQAAGRGVIAETNERTVNGERICQVKIGGPLDAFLMALTETRSSPIGSLSITRVDGGALRLENRLDVGSTQPGARGGSSGIEASLTEGMFAGRMLRWKLTAPQVLSSNGTISADGRSVEWAVPISAAFRETKTFEATFKVEMSLQDRIKLWFVEKWHAIRAVLRRLLGD